MSNTSAPDSTTPAGYLDFHRSPSNKQCRVRADFIAMINESKSFGGGNYCMVIAIDGNQIYVQQDYTALTVLHGKALKELAEMQRKPLATPAPVLHDVAVKKTT